MSDFKAKMHQIRFRLRLCPRQDTSIERHNDLTCLYVNARSLVTGNKFHTFEAWVHDLDPDIIGVTESWANSEILDAEILLPDMICSETGQSIVMVVEYFCMLGTNFVQSIVNYQPSFQSRYGAVLLIPKGLRC